MPSFKQTMNNTGIVILCVIVVGIFIWLFDAVAGALIEFLLGCSADRWRICLTARSGMWSTPIPDTKIR